MLRKFLVFLSSLNPIRVWREEKALDREANLQMVSDVCAAIRAQAEVSAQSLRVVETFMHTFTASGEPETRVVRNEDEYLEALQRWNIKPEDLEQY